jgi:DNA-nicking Smr family endonuclease
MKKKPREEKPAPSKSPTFRPLEAQLKALTAASVSDRILTKPAPTPAREPTLTKQEREELAALDRSHNDEFFFQRLMSGVVPLGGDNRGRMTTTPKLPKREAKPAAHVRDPDEDVRDHLMNLVEGGARFEVTDDGRHLSGRRLDLADSTFRRLRRGELPIDGRLDLHGKRADEARDALETFLRERRARRDRVVLVIHGRGEHSPAGVGVLRGEIAAWLSQGRSSQHVAAFATAHKEEGGEGALYVLLRP